MLVIPAIDIKSGKCVRLFQGSFNKINIYGDNPVEMALRWEREGAPMLHIVDLDAAISGIPINKEHITAILKAVRAPVQIGGGIRNIETAEYYIRQGARSIVVTTLAYEHPEEVITLATRYPDRISIGIDVISGAVAIKGWTQTSNLSPKKFVEMFRNTSIYAFIFTDIYKDGTLTGIEPERVKSLLEGIDVPAIISGGVSSIEDLKKIKALNNKQIKGVIIGRALYTGAIKLSEAIRNI